jgi:hypothetical protein
LEGISRRIYSPLHTSAADDRAQVPDRGRLGPSQRTQRRSVTRYDADQRRVIFAGKRRSHGCQSQQPCPRRAADLRDSQPPALLRPGRVGRVWHPPGLPPGPPHASPGAEPCDARAGPVEGCPRAAAWSGSARPTGCHTTTSVKIVGGHSEPMIVGHFMVTKHIQITQNDHKQQAFAVAKSAGNHRYPRTTTTTVRESLVNGPRYGVRFHSALGGRAR